MRCHFWGWVIKGLWLLFWCSLSPSYHLPWVKLCSEQPYGETLRARNWNFLPTAVCVSLAGDPQALSSLWRLQPWPPAWCNLARDPEPSVSVNRNDQANRGDCRSDVFKKRDDPIRERRISSIFFFLTEMKAEYLRTGTGRLVNW